MRIIVINSPKENIKKEHCDKSQITLFPLILLSGVESHVGTAQYSSLISPSEIRSKVTQFEKYGYYSLFFIAHCRYIAGKL